ncbi:MAG: polysaccharide deacetylase family protein [Acidimicrobiia bacterium]
MTAPAAAPPPTLTRTNRLRRRAQPDAIFGVDTDQPLVALTFDDGPDPAYTPRILDLLAARHVRATFFVVGVNALAHRDLLKREVAAGHSIGNHTRTHPDLERLGPEEVLAEIDGGEDAIVAAGAPRPTLFRPPKGLTDEIVATFANAERYRTVFWDLAVEHFVRHLGVDEGVRRLLARVRPGSIILAHDGGHTPGRPVIDREETLAAMPPLLDGLARLGLRPVDVPALLRAARRTD